MISTLSISNGLEIFDYSGFSVVNTYNTVEVGILASKVGSYKYKVSYDVADDGWESIHLANRILEVEVFYEDKSSFIFWGPYPEVSYILKLAYKNYANREFVG